jgi:hypothetical protein
MDKSFVIGILRGEYERVGALRPNLPHEWHVSLARRILGRNRAWRHPERQAVDEEFTFFLRHIGSNCGASTTDRLYIPPTWDDRDRNLIITHEYDHGMCQRFHITDANESDMWRVTARRVKWAQAHPRGLLLYPEWFVENIQDDPDPAE